MVVFGILMFADSIEYTVYLRILCLLFLLKSFKPGTIEQKLTAKPIRAFYFSRSI